MARSHSINSAFGPVRRPNPGVAAEGIDRSAGGSSGGSAAAVAARLCDGYVPSYVLTPRQKIRLKLSFLGLSVLIQEDLYASLQHIAVFTA